jgi:hypothetical protein
MESVSREFMIERAGRSGMAEPAALLIPAIHPEPGWSVFILQYGRPTDITRQGFLTRSLGKYYAQGCDIYGWPERPLIRPMVMHGEGSPAFDTLLEALAAFLGHVPNTRLRYAHD